MPLTRPLKITWPELLIDGLLKEANAAVVPGAACDLSATVW